jgi:hypothetical protein
MDVSAPGPFLLSPFLSPRSYLPFPLSPSLSLTLMTAGNSQRDRTLDQQCTVTRSGLGNAPVESALSLFLTLL